LNGAELVKRDNPQTYVTHLRLPFFELSPDLYLVYRISDGVLSYLYDVEGNPSSMWKSAALSYYSVDSAGIYVIAAGTELKNGVRVNEDYFFTIDSGKFTEVVRAPYHYVDGDGTNWYGGGTYYLDSYAPTLTYAAAASISLSIGKAEGKDYFQIGFDGDEGGNVTFEGPVEDIPIKGTALPQNHVRNGSGYRITASMYIHEDGFAVMFATERVTDENAANYGEYIIPMVSGYARFAAMYDGVTYRSDKLTAVNLLNAAGAAAFAPIITILGYDASTARCSR
jgi:hypothetical protein